MFYLVKTPRVLKKIYPECIWEIPSNEPVIYLSFDDGPHPEATVFVLETLRQFNATATFFCIGKNVADYPELYKRLVNEGHQIGNHTFDHLNGWKVNDKEYIENILKAAQYIDSKLFRPPYGRITRFQVKLLTRDNNIVKSNHAFKIIMWDIVSGDFDASISSDKCTKNVIKNARPGSIVVFHDSEKAFPRMKKALPETLKYFQQKGYRFRSIL